MAYTKINWQDLPNTTTPINATNLNKMDKGIADANGAVGVADYDNTSTYEINDLCIYQNIVYICTTAIATPEAFTVAHWKAVAFKDVLIVKSESSNVVTELNKRIDVSNINNAVIGIKGNAESSYRTGNVNITPANIGALSLSGGTLTGSLYAPNILPTASSSALGSAGALWNKLWTNEVELPSLKLYTSGNASVLGVIEQLTVRYKGNIDQFMPVSASAFNVNSSRRYKENIKDMTEEEANKILDINVVKFDYKVKQNGTNVAGVIAEPTYEVLPNVVTLAKIDGKEVPDSVDYSKFVPYLIKKIQMQEEEIAELKKKL